MGMNLYGLAIAMVFVSIFAFGYASFIGNLGTEYNIIVSTDSIVQNNFMNQSAQLSEDNQAIIDSGAVDSTAQDLAILKDTVTAARQMKQAASFTTTSINGLNDFIYIHPTIITALKTLLLLSVIAGILYLFFKVKI